MSVYLFKIYNMFMYALGKMEIELHSTLGDSRDVFRKQERLDRVRLIDFSVLLFSNIILLLTVILYSV